MMAYTIKQLAQLSGVSTRTLRFYDKTGLLKPAYYGENQYRYYEEEQLLLLQQILFYRELDFSLHDIHQVLSSDTFDKITSLKSHKSMLQDKLQKITTMLTTIDNTVLHLQGDIMMQVEEFFDPIRLRNRSIQKEYDKYLIDKGIFSQEELDASWQKLKFWTQADWDQFKNKGDNYYRKMAESIDLGLKPYSLEVQDLVHKHYLLIKPLWLFDKTSYLKLSDAYRHDSNFQKFCAIYDDRLLNFLVEAMEYYATHRLA
jgi:DNA-binding transcriptional MerR regulator